MDDFVLTPRLERLLERLRKDSVATPGRALASPPEQRHYAELAHAVYAANRDRPEVERKADFLERFAREFPIDIRPDELILGSQRFGFANFSSYLSEKQVREMDFRGNMGHVLVDYGRVLRRGVSGLLADIDAMAVNDETVRRNQRAFRRVVQALSTFAARHAAASKGEAAETCRWISERPPETFRQSLQLLWFTQMFLKAEANASAISFGRIDQLLWPYLKAELDAQTISMDAALELLGCFWLKCCEAAESQNAIVGGVTEQGEDAENPLSLMCLRVCRALKVWQPSLSVRLGETSSETLWDEAAALCAEGFGMPSFFNDAVVIRSLEAIGLSTERARDWGIVGCYEANPQGDSLGLTVAGGWILPETLLEFLDRNYEFPTFDALLAQFKHELLQTWRTKLSEFEQHWKSIARSASPFQSVCLTGCIESGRTAQEGGARYSLYGVNILGLGTIVDSLHVIHELVFDRGTISLADFRAQWQADFVDESFRVECRNLARKYGTDSEETNELAADLSRVIADAVVGSSFSDGVRPYPAFFRWLADVSPDLAATPDGRRAGENVSYGAGPGVLCDTCTPTTIMNSVAHVAHDRCACGNPMMISLNKGDAAGPAGWRRIRDLVETYFRAGGFHVHFNIVSADALRDAQRAPEDHPHLTVRISGLSARFVALGRDLQDAIIERTERHM